jgi:hypothetical protein
MRTNGVRALHVLEARVLKHLILDDSAAQATPEVTANIRQAAIA